MSARKSVGVARVFKSRLSVASAHGGVVLALVGAALAACAPSADAGSDTSTSEVNATSAQWLMRDWKERDDW